MHSFRYFALAAVMAAAVLPIACASSGGGSTSDVAMQVFTLDRPPQCDYEEVGRVSRDRRVTGRSESSTRQQDSRELIKKMGGDAVIRVDMPKEYIVIEFTDPDCRE